MYYRDTDSIPRIGTPGNLKSTLSTEPTDHELQSLPGVQAIIRTKHGSPTFTIFAQTQIQYKNLNPSFLDEFRVSLPVARQGLQHLLFCIYNVPKKRGVPLTNEELFIWNPSEKVDCYSLRLFVSSPVTHVPSPISE